MKFSAAKWLRAAVSAAAALPPASPGCPVTAIIVAAGSSSRMGGIDKLTAELAGCPVLVRTLRAFQRCAAVTEIILVVSPERIEEFTALVRRYGLRKVSTITEGGASRLESVCRGFAQVSLHEGLVAVHDGARPLISPADIDAVIAAARLHGAAAAAVPATDTLKRCDADGRIVETVSRSGVWRVQTPQIFSYDLFRVALHYARASGAEVTDDCGVLEACGMNVYVCPCGIHNLKITVAEDLPVARALLQLEKNGKD